MIQQQLRKLIYLSNRVLGTPKLQTVLQDVTVEAPQNFDHLQGNFSREQKLKIYEYAIENTKKLDNNTIDEV